MPYSSCVKFIRSLRWASLLALGLSAVPLAAQPTPGQATVVTPGNVTMPGYVTTSGAGNVTTPTTAMSSADRNNQAAVMVEHDFSADLKDGIPGNMSVTDYEIYGNYLQKFSDTDRLIVGADYLYRDFNFDGVGAPFSDVQQVGATGWYTHDINNQWGAFGYLYGGFAAEKNASFGDGAEGAIAVGPTVKISPDLSLAFGPMLYTRFADDVGFTLMADMGWNFLPQWNLHLNAGVSDGASVSYDVFNNHQTILDASLQFNDFWFRAQDAPGGAGRGVDESNVTLEFGVRQAFADNFYVRGYISGIFDREYQFYTAGSSSNSFKVDSTAGIGLELGMSF